MSEFVSICDVGPRDGLQIARTRMSTDDKVKWIAAIAAAGVREIEVGSYLGRHQRVLGFEIAMDHTFLVHVEQRFANLRGKAQRALGLHRLLGANNLAQ